MNNSLILSIYDIDESNAGSYWCQWDENDKGSGIIFITMLLYMLEVGIII